MDITICVLSWRSPITLANSLASYKEKGLLTAASQCIGFVQEADPDVEYIMKYYGFSTLASRDNIGISAALATLIRASNSDMFLFLEDDFELISENDDVIRRLRAASGLISAHEADCVRLRHRATPGEPLCTRHLEGIELENSSHLMECIHWTSNPAASFPSYITEITRDGEKFYTCSSKYANYTNNPCLYKTAFVRDVILPICETGSWSLEVDMDRVWGDMNLTVAQGEGLFSHVRIDHARRSTAAASVESISKEFLPIPQSSADFMHKISFRTRDRIQTPQLSKSRTIEDFDLHLINRIISSYQNSLDDNPDYALVSLERGDGFYHKLHHALKFGDTRKVGTILSNPLYNAPMREIEPYSNFSLRSLQDPAFARSLYDNLARLAEAVGAVSLDHPEVPISFDRPLTSMSVSDIVSRIEETFSYKIKFPSPYSSEIGLASSHGIIGSSAMNSVLQAITIHNLAGDKGVVEIGGGLGRTAYYCRKFGTINYAIVDHPLINALKAYFLGSALGPSEISLYKEPACGLRLIPPHQFFSLDDQYEISLNFGTLTRMPGELARLYVDKLSRSTKYFISINHEFDLFRFRTIYAGTPGWRVVRTPYWLRQGYVQEIVSFESQF